MKYFWYGMAMFAFCVMAVYVFFRNGGRIIHNISSKDKLPVPWDVMREFCPYTELFYNEE